MPVKISFRRTGRGIGLPEGAEGAVKRGIRRAIAEIGPDMPCAVDVTITDDAGIRELNRAHRGIDAATDVLSFPMEEFLNGKPMGDASPGPEGGAVFLGDIVISAPRAVLQAKEYGHDDAREFGFLAVHAVLHLLGFDHERKKADERLMRSFEETILEKAGLFR